MRPSAFPSSSRVRERLRLLGVDAGELAEGLDVDALEQLGRDHGVSVEWLTRETEPACVAEYVADPVSADVMERARAIERLGVDPLRAGAPGRAPAALTVRTAAVGREAPATD